MEKNITQAISRISLLIFASVITINIIIYRLNATFTDYFIVHICMFLLVGGVKLQTQYKSTLDRLKREKKEVSDSYPFSNN